MRWRTTILAVIGFWVVATARAGDEAPPLPFRAALRLEAAPTSRTNAKSQPLPNRIARARIDFGAALIAFGPDSLRVEAVDEAGARRPVPFRFDHRFNPADQSYRSAGDLVFVAPSPGASRFAVYFATKGDTPSKPNEGPPSLPVGDGDILRLEGKGTSTLSLPACYPCVVDVDGDGRHDLVGSDRYGTGARVTWFRNIGSNSAPVFSEREIYRLETADGQNISNPNGGWLLTSVLFDWDGDGKRDLLVGGWCRYLTFYKNIGSDHRPALATGKVILDAKVLPGLDYGPNPNTTFQGVFIEPCDWDGDGNPDLLYGTYLRRHMYFFRNTGRDAEQLPILGTPMAVEAGGKPIDYLAHNQPSVGDWDGDGDLDLMAGQYYTEASPAPGNIAGCYYFENVGDRRNPKLAAGVSLRDARGRLVTAGFHNQPVMVDWNQDGKQDILVTGGGFQLYLNEGTAREPKLVRAEVPFVGSRVCTVGSFAYPVAIDLDKDGTLDLVVGEGNGNVFCFKGRAGLQFSPPIKLKSAGKEIHEVGCPDGGEAHRGYVKVALADWNGDSRPDLIVWTNNGLEGWQRGTLEADGWCLKFFAGTADPFDFSPPVEIKAAGRHIRAGYRCKPDVADLDGDGLLDLVVACGDGKVNGPCTLMLLKNVGTKTSWELAEPVALTLSDGHPLGTPIRTAVRLVDWDRDGDLDLITGNHSSFYFRYWENVGTKTKPSFMSPKPFKSVNEVTKSHHEGGADAVDLDGDGTLDLVVGNGDSGVLHFFRRSFLESEWAAAAVSLEK